MVSIQMCVCVCVFVVVVVAVVVAVAIYFAFKIIKISSKLLPLVSGTNIST